jgi:hypothetical protein
MTRTRNKIAPAKDQSERWDGGDLIVRRGVREFRLVRGKNKAITVTCLTCSVSGDAGGIEGERLDAFMRAHEHAEPAPAVDVQHLGTIEDLIADVRKLKGDEIEVVRLVVEGLLHDGRPQYGVLDLDTDTRDLEQEGIEESRDLVVYDLGNLIKRVRQRARRTA